MRGHNESTYRFEVKKGNDTLLFKEASEVCRAFGVPRSSVYFMIAGNSMPKYKGVTIRRVCIPVFRRVKIEY